jgi:hypothetical protein
MSCDKKDIDPLRQSKLYRFSWILSRVSKLLCILQLHQRSEEATPVEPVLLTSATVHITLQLSPFDGLQPRVLA